MNQFKIFTNSLFLFSIISICASAQNSEQVEMADSLHSHGKIYVVVIVLAIIFLGIIALLINIDRKVSEIEKAMKDGKD